jgi:hypothetical protein
MKTILKVIACSILVIPFSIIMLLCVLLVRFSNFVEEF